MDKNEEKAAVDRFVMDTSDEARDKTPEEVAAMAVFEKDQRASRAMYPNNILESFGTGAMLDLRVRMAIGFLNTSPVLSTIHSADRTGMSGEQWAKACAVFALDMATELMAEAERRGLVEPLPESDELDDKLRKQAKRSAAYNALMQIEGNKFILAEQSRVAPGFPIAPGRPPGRH